jgi:AcrR family transcriptional regulator
MPPDRFDDLIRCATEVFSAQGYRRTQMAGIADAVGVSKATLYLYVESKDALFRLCLEHADDPNKIGRPELLPVPTPPPGRMAEQVEARIRQAARFPVLTEALRKPRADDIRQELHDGLDELYTLLEKNCRVVRMLERCSDHPELGPLWHARVRAPGRGEMARYVAQRVRAGQLRQVEHPQLASRIALETIVTWAMHIKWDRAPEPYEPVSTKAVVIEQVSRGLLPDAALHSESEVRS